MLKELEVMYQNAIYISTQEVCHMVHIFFGSSLGKV